MSAIDLAADLCRVFEGFRSAPYRCPAGVATIGYGCTHYPDGTQVRLTDAPVTKYQAETMLKAELVRVQQFVLALCPGIQNARQTAAITDFAFNLGVGRLRASTLRKRINEQDWDSAKKELLKWNKAGGKVLAGLKKRREAEASLLS